MGERSVLRLTLSVMLSACVLTAGCTREEAAPPPQKPGDVRLMLFCGAGIRPASDALMEAFKEKEGIEIDATYAGSSRLLGQITANQQGDLFMPGAALYVDKAIENGLADGLTRRSVAAFVPVIFVQKGNLKGVHSLTDLSKEGLRVGLGDERACAVGKISLQIFAKSGIPYADIEPNVVYKSGTVNELGVAIQLKTVDAVILWDANARQFADYGDTVAIPAEQNVVSEIPIVVLSASKHPEESRQFVDFVLSEEGRRILKQQGYTAAGG